jgi:hypothetical protein
MLTEGGVYIYRPILSFLYIKQPEFWRLSRFYN